MINQFKGSKPGRHGSHFFIDLAKKESIYWILSRKTYFSWEKNIIKINRNDHKKETWNSMRKKGGLYLWLSWSPKATITGFLLSNCSPMILAVTKGPFIFYVSSFCDLCMIYVLIVNPNWHEGGHFPPPCPFWMRFCQLNFYQKFPTFFVVKIDINLNN